jgi:hypothetical protein
MFFLEIIIGGLMAGAILYPLRNRDEDQFRKFFAGSLLIAALIYVAFAGFGISSGSSTTNWLIVELAGVLIYLFFAYAGVKVSVWFLVIGWAAHILWDVVLHGGANTPFVPGFYPPVCIGFDLVFALYIAYKFYFKESF